VSAILYCVSHFTYFVSHFRVVSAIAMLCQSFYFSIRYFIYVVSHSLVILFLLCVLQFYYLDNLLSNIPVPAGTPRCQFFISDMIDRISILD
jgi:hypothetical protein